MKMPQIGQTVWFKSDIEQSGTVIAISSDRNWVKVQNVYGFEGDYIGGQTTTWIEVEDLFE